MAGSFAGFSFLWVMLGGDKPKTVILKCLNWKNIVDVPIYLSFCLEMSQIAWSVRWI